MTAHPPTLQPSTDSASSREESARLRTAYGERVAHRLDSWSNPGFRYIMQERERLVTSALARAGMFPLRERLILDVGCGRGRWERDFVNWGADPARVAGIDLLIDHIASARASSASGTPFCCGSAWTLPYRSGSFDIVVQSTLFSSLPDRRARELSARELARVVRPTGIILWYDLRMDNPRNPNVHGIGHRELRELFPGCTVELHATTLAPPVARALARGSELACALLAKLPFLCTHYFGIIRTSPSRTAPVGSATDRVPSSSR